jgi:TolB-like protein/Tfp pilus assembly protein PilF
VNSPNFFAELKRRNVVRMAGLYLVGAWLLTQVASTVLPMFGAPDWLPRSIVILLAIGFVPALIFSWVFELTPEGLKRESEVAPTQSIARGTGHKIVGVTVALAIIATGLMIFRLAGTDRRAVRPDRDDGSGSSRTASLPPKSIAVLPFDNLSRDPDNAYFCEGVQDEILTRLAKVADLKVIARTSTQKFKSSPENLPEIARQLGVLNILEGSVQKANDQVRVNVQLINATTNAHLWAEIYDRKLTDIFVVESDIAKAIADALQAKLSGAETTAIAKKPTENPEAYELYLKGRLIWNRRTEADLRKAAEYFQQAIDKDSSYALAYAGLADCYSTLAGYISTAPKELIDRAFAPARRSLELDDSLAEAHTALANALAADLQFAAAEVEFKRAFALNPNYASAHQWYGEILQSLGRHDEAVAEIRRAHDLDPLSLIINSVLASAYFSAGRFEEAWQQNRRTLELDSNFGVSYWVRAQLLEQKGQFDEAIADFKRSEGAISIDATRCAIACVLARSGKPMEAQKILDELTNQSQGRFVSSYARSEVYAVLGNKDEALRFLEKAYDERTVPVGGAGNGGPIIDNRFDSLRNDPRFQAFVAKFAGQTK